MKPRWKKGTVLLQTLVMSVLLSMIAVMMMKWVLARYMMAARNYRSVATTTRVGGYAQVASSYWNFNTPSLSILPTLPDSKVINFIIYSPSPMGVRTITMRSDEDN